MKSISLAVLFILAVVSSSANYKINSYNIKLKYENSRKPLSVNLTLFLQHNQEKDIDLLFSSKCNISSISIMEGKKIRNLDYVRKGSDTIKLMLDEQILTAPVLQILFSYSYPLENDTVIMLDRGHRWYPMIAENIAPFTMQIEIPPQYIAVSAGELTEERNNGTLKYCTYSTNTPVFKIPLIIAPENYYTVGEKDCGNIKICSYFITEHSLTLIDSIQTNICSLINYFNSNIGLYSFKRFTIIETPLFEGSNIGSSIITVGTESINSFSAGNKDWLNLTVACQWVSAGVFPRLFCKGFWFLSLSVPHYLRLMYTESERGEDAFNKELTNLSEKHNSFAGTEKDIPILDIDYPNTKEKGILIYCKGVLAVNKLRKLMGEANWTNFLREFYTSFSGKIIILDDLVNLIDKYDSSGESSKQLMKMLSEKGKIN
jgi:hypothetical protein